MAAYESKESRAPGAEGARRRSLAESPPSAAELDDDLQELLLLAAAATPGPWALRRDDSGTHEAIVVSATARNRRGGDMIVAATRWPLAALGASATAAAANARFIAAAREAVPRLIEELARLRAAHGGERGPRQEG
jgi:hypothetical protein